MTYLYSGEVAEGIGGLRALDFKLQIALRSISTKCTSALTTLVLAPPNADIGPLGCVVGESSRTFTILREGIPE